nr:MAG TPA: hypothetical protein [Caudoviricetes sp.]
MHGPTFYNNMTSSHNLFSFRWDKFIIAKKSLWNGNSIEGLAKIIHEVIISWNEKNGNHA